ncbi:biotin biosynthesis protein BioY [Halostagnicola larsenii XH-48]|uniref:Biotin biosynthesis protein BioY n=1 Tax=Halostagnicola larsenii XH-48 TaxID=797299 RepID=W0JNX8_9EURY|nr:biotin transporter BioY [Halostagnicola larsenii]AHF98864.1 biotin biosynthesis protein BioY [Halostagnicola larsenii XH-48]
MQTEQGSVDLVEGDVVRVFARAALLAALMGATAFVAIPVAGVPGTLQMLVVFLAGLYLGPVWGPFAIVLYLLAGTLGAPIFSGGNSGLGVVLGPYGGFLLTFPIGAVLIGAIVHRGRDLRDPASVSLPVVVFALVVATTAVYLVGFLWYAWVSEMAVLEAFTVVALPLIPGDLLKMAAAVAIVRSGLIEAT